MNCIGCKHFYVTWQKDLPYGCKAWGVKSRQHPGRVVKSSSGMECQLFLPKSPDRKGGQKPSPGGRFI